MGSFRCPSAGNTGGDTPSSDLQPRENSFGECGEIPTRGSFY